MKAFLKGLAAIAVLVMAVNTANAGFMTLDGFVGHTQMDDSVVGTPHVTAVVSFAVWDNGTSDFAATFPALAATDLFNAVDLSAPFLYLYQITNFNLATDNLAISNFYLADPLDLIDAIGYFSGRVFTDLEGNVGPALNPALGVGPVAVLVDDLIVPSLSDPGFASETAAGDPDFASDAGGGVKKVGYLPSPPGDGPLADGAFSSVIIATSNFGPSYRPALLEDGGPLVSSDGNVPIPTPEPATLALLLAGAPVGLVALRRRRKTA